MKSHIVKMKEGERYFQVTFSPTNEIEKVLLVKNKEDATFFQDISLVIAPTGKKMKVGEIRKKEFSYWLQTQGAGKDDIIIEELDAPVQSLLTKEQKDNIKL